MNIIKKRFFLFIAGVILLSSCGDMMAREILRVKMSHPGDLVPKYSFVQMKKGDKIAIWSDMDFNYIGVLKMTVILELYLQDTLHETIELSPLERNMVLDEVKEKQGSRTNWKFLSKNKEVTIKEDGNYKCIAYLKTSNGSFNENKAEIVLKRKF